MNENVKDEIIGLIEGNTKIILNFVDKNFSVGLDKKVDYFKTYTKNIDKLLTNNSLYLGVVVDNTEDVNKLSNQMNSKNTLFRVLDISFSKKNKYYQIDLVLNENCDDNKDIKKYFNSIDDFSKLVDFNIKARITSSDKKFLGFDLYISIEKKRTVNNNIADKMNSYFEVLKTQWKSDIKTIEKKYTTELDEECDVVRKRNEEYKKSAIDEVIHRYDSVTNSTINELIDSYKSIISKETAKINEFYNNQEQSIRAQMHNLNSIFNDVDDYNEKIDEENKKRKTNNTEPKCGNTNILDEVTKLVSAYVKSLSYDDKKNILDKESDVFKKIENDIIKMFELNDGNFDVEYYIQQIDDLLGSDSYSVLKELGFDFGSEFNFDLNSGIFTKQK